MLSRGFSAILTVILVLLLGLSSYFLYLNLPALPGEGVGAKSFTSTGDFNVTSQSGNYTSSKQFYANMRYKKKIISYNLDPACDENKRNGVKRAFSILEEKTILNFYESNFNSEINILCSEVEPEAEYADHFVAGEGGPVEVINTSL